MKEDYTKLAYTITETDLQWAGWASRELMGELQSLDGQA